MATLLSHPHRRYNILTDEWILVSPQRIDRPWQGKVEDFMKEKIPSHDPNCYLCPGNKRANDKINPNLKAPMCLITILVRYHLKKKIYLQHNRFEIRQRME